MGCRLLKLFVIFATYILLFLIAKLVFLAVNHNIYAGIDVSDVFEILLHGYRMDQSMAAYLSVVPALLLMASIWTKSSRWYDRTMAVWRYISAFMVVMIVMLDSVLYGYWQFKLDTTPIFYFFSSPSAAFASVSSWVPAVGILTLVVVGILLAHCMGFLWRWPRLNIIGGIKQRWISTAVTFIALPLLFVAIRGGFTVSTMNPSAAYFSEEARMNHAAVNPMFSLMYSAAHSSDFSRQFRYFSDDELQPLLHELEESAVAAYDSISPTIRLREGVTSPDVYLVILESFSSHLMPMLGGEPVAMRLDSIAREGATFTNFYASSFRTDRAIPAILSGYPAQPSTSIMKFVDKAERLPSIARSLSEQAGYKCSYYYGGDINFVNQKAYLVSSKFSEIISDTDFPLSSRLSKWGAHDDCLWQKVWEDVKADKSAGPKLRVVQTSSSHEPYEVPFTSRRFTNVRAVSFEFADSCMGAFVDSLKASPKWHNSLVVLVPDHWGVYPQGLTDPVERHRIPLVITGGAISPDSKGIKISTPGVQSDIAATLLALLGVDADEFVMSKNLLDPMRSHYAFFSEPDFTAIVSPNDSTVVSTADNRIVLGTSGNADKVRAFLQNLYNDLDAR